MDPLRPLDEPALLTDEVLDELLRALEGRRPGAVLPSAGIRPRRSPWTYRDIRLLEGLRAERARRDATKGPSADAERSQDAER